MAFGAVVSQDADKLHVPDHPEQSKPIAFGAVVSHDSNTLHVPECLKQPKSIAVGAVVSHPAEPESKLERASVLRVLTVWIRPA